MIPDLHLKRLYTQPLALFIARFLAIFLAVHFARSLALIHAHVTRRTPREPLRH